MTKTYWNDKKVFVAGGAGFIGSYLLEMLADEKLAAKIAAHFGFHFIDFIKLTGQYDSFGIAKVKELQAKQRKSLISSFKDLLKR